MKAIRTIAALLFAIISIAHDASARKRLVLDAVSKPTLFRLDVAGAITPSGETFSRASTATYIDASGIIQTASSGVKRNSHYIGGKPTLLLEGQRTNQCLQSEDFATGWTTSLATVATNTTVAPDGATTGDTITFTANPGGKVFRLVAQTGTGTNVVSVWAKTASGTKVFRLGITDNTVVSNLSGDFTATTTWQRFAFAFTTASAVQKGIEICNNSAGTAGDVIVWGAQFENAPFESSYIATTTASVTRAADSLNFPYLHPPREMTVFARLVDTGMVLATNAQLYNVGGTSSRFVSYSNGTRYLAFHHNGTSGVSSTPLTGPVIGDTVEIGTKLFGTGSVSQLQSINSAAVTESTASGALTLNSAWSEQKIYLNDYAGGGFAGFGAYRDVIIAKGIRDLSYFRSKVAP